MLVIVTVSKDQDFAIDVFAAEVSEIHARNCNEGQVPCVVFSHECIHDRHMNEDSGGPGFDNAFPNFD